MNAWDEKKNSFKGQFDQHPRCCFWKITIILPNYPAFFLVVFTQFLIIWKFRQIYQVMIQFYVAATTLKGSFIFVLRGSQTNLTMDKKIEKIIMEPNKLWCYRCVLPGFRNCNRQSKWHMTQNFPKKKQTARFWNNFVCNYTSQLNLIMSVPQDKKNRQPMWRNVWR